jgi:GNAT superfamily N-acetyltransferase
MQVRKGTAADAPVLAGLQWQWRTEEQPQPSTDRAAFLKYFSAWVMDHVSSHLPFVVEVEGRVVAMAWLMLGSRVPTPTAMDRPTGDIQSVYVVPELRNRGLGAALIDAVLQEAQDRELERVTVHSGDRALPFYLRSGFADDHRWLQRKS